MENYTVHIFIIIIHIIYLLGFRTLVIIHFKKLTTFVFLITFAYYYIILRSATLLSYMDSSSYMWMSKDAKAVVHCSYIQLCFHKWQWFAVKLIYDNIIGSIGTYIYYILASKGSWTKVHFLSARAQFATAAAESAYDCILLVHIFISSVCVLYFLIRAGDF